MRSIIAAACVLLVAGCSQKLDPPKRLLPERPAAYYDKPKGLSDKETELCEMASKRKLQGLLTEIPSLCRKVQYNFWGWSYLRDWFTRIYNSLLNSDGKSGGWFGA